MATAFLVWCSLEPAFVEVLATSLAVEARDVAALHRMPRLDQDVADTVRRDPDHECSTVELWAIVGSNGLQIAAKQRRAAQHSGHILA